MSMTKAEIRGAFFDAARKLEEVELESLGQVVLMEPLKVKDYRELEGKLEDGLEAKQTEEILKIVARKIYHRESEERLFQDNELDKILDLPINDPKVQDLIAAFQQVNAGQKIEEEDGELKLEDDDASKEAQKN